MKRHFIHQYGFVVDRELVPFLFRVAVERHPLPKWFLNKDVFQMPMDEYIQRAREDTLHPCCYNMDILQSMIASDVDLVLHQKFCGTACTEDMVTRSVRDRYDAEFAYDPILYLPAKESGYLYAAAYNHPVAQWKELLLRMKPYLKYVPRDFRILKYICNIEGSIED